MTWTSSPAHQPAKQGAAASPAAALSVLLSGRHGSYACQVEPAGVVFSRSGDDVSAAFPEIAAALAFTAVLDGELLAVRDDIVASFNDLQQRLGRKAPSAALTRRHPAHVRLYDILVDASEDLRGLPFAARRPRLEGWFARMAPKMMDLSPLVPFEDWADLAALRGEARDAGRKGLMLKRCDSRWPAEGAVV